jgi:hydrogenase maturation factor
MTRSAHLLRHWKNRHVPSHSRPRDRIATAPPACDLGGIRKEISLALVPHAQIDDYVIVHVGYALGLIDPKKPSAPWQCSKS